VLIGSQVGRCMLLPLLFGTGLSKHERSNSIVETEVSAAQGVRLEPKKPKMFVRVSPQSWVDKPESAPVGRREEFGQPHVVVESDVSALGEAEGVDSAEICVGADVWVL